MQQGLELICQLIIPWLGVEKKGGEGEGLTRSLYADNADSIVVNIVSDDQPTHTGHRCEIEKSWFITCYL